MIEDLTLDQLAESETDVAQKRKQIAMFSAIASLALLTSARAPLGAVEPAKTNHARPPRPLADTGPLVVSEDELERYRREPDCEGPKFGGAKLTLDMSDLSADVAIHARRPYALEYGQQAAINHNRLAQAAADKGCPETARRLWLGVIEKFTGTGYAAMRQRAQIGIDDLRSAANGRP